MEFIGQLNDANLLYKVVQRVAHTDLRPHVISNYEMGLVFEELIRRFAESSNETAGEHFTPRDIVRLERSAPSRQFAANLGTFHPFANRRQGRLEWEALQKRKSPKPFNPIIKPQSWRMFLTLIWFLSNLKSCGLCRFLNGRKWNSRLSRISQQNIELHEPGIQDRLPPVDGLGTGRARDKKEEFMSNILQRLNELFVTDQLTDKDLVNYAVSIRDKISENETVMDQLANNSADQAMLGDFLKAVDDALIDSIGVNQNQMMQLMSDPDKAKIFAAVIFDLLKNPEVFPRA